ncbi:MAG: hypothetical protein ACW960_10630 [Candidatus Thorarchaeota archaeon]|jgi:hypothetical protein
MVISLAGEEIRGGINIMQFDPFLMYFQFGLPLLIIGILLIALRVIAVKRYHAERLTAGETTALGKLGKNLANTPYLSFNIFMLVTLSVGIISVLLSIFQQIGFEDMVLPLGVTALVMTAVMVPFYTVTVRGRAIWWFGKIIRDHQQYDHQEWVIQKRLVELIREKEDSDEFRAKVVQQVLEKLMALENMTGDAVRKIMADPAGPIDRFEDKTIPNPLWDFKYSLFLMVFCYATILILTWGLAIGIVTDFAMYSSVVIILIGLTLVSVCGVFIEGRIASRKRLRLRIEMASSEA